MTKDRPLLVEMTFEAKTYDIDYAGIVHNSVYIRWLEDMRLQLLAEYHPLEKMLELNQSPVLERTEINYHRPMRLFDQVEGRMWIEKLGKARWELEAEFILGDVKVSSARQTGYFVDLERLRPLRIPEDLRKIWERSSEDSTS